MIKLLLWLILFVLSMLAAGADRVGGLSDCLATVVAVSPCRRGRAAPVAEHVDPAFRVVAGLGQ